MKVIFPLINLSSHGGVRILVELANGFAQRGVEVTILIPQGKNSSIYSLEKNVIIKQIGILTGFKILDYLLFLILSPLYLRNCISIANFFVTMYPVWAARILFKTNYLYFVQEMEAKYKGLKKYLLNPLCKLTYRSKRIIASNSYVENDLKKIGAVCQSIIHIGVSDIFFDAAKVKNNKEYDILYFLRWEHWKRIDRFEKVLSQLSSKYRFCCISQKEELSKKYNDKIKVFDRPSDNALVDIIDSSRVLLMTSSHEGFSLPPLECMARGVPSVIFECGGPSLYIKNGINSFEVKNETDASKRLIELLSDTSLYENMSREAVNTSLAYRNSSAVDKFCNLIR